MMAFRSSARQGYGIAEFCGVKPFAWSIAGNVPQVQDLPEPHNNPASHCQLPGPEVMGHSVSLPGGFYHVVSVVQCYQTQPRTSFVAPAVSNSEGIHNGEP
jgi:hypothetical protein